MLHLGELVVTLKGNNTSLKRTLAESKTETAAAGESMSSSNDKSATAVAASWARAFAQQQTHSRVARTNLTADIEATRGTIRKLAEEFGRTRNQSLLGDLTSERSKLRELEHALADLTTVGATAATHGLGLMGKAVDFVFSKMTGWIPILFAAATVLASIGPLSAFAGAALGAIPALATGGFAALATLALGAVGLSEAFHDTAQSGGAVVDRAHQIALAERRLTDANREATDAQEGLNRARLTAAERMRDLNRNLAGAHLDERAAVNAVADAQRNLDRARLTEHPERIARAQLAYEQAKQSLDDVRDRVEDLTEEQVESAQKGVEGSDEVRAALDRQRHAVESISDAQYDLGHVQTETSGGAAKQATAIAASAAAAVAMIKSLKGKYDELRLDVQQRLFAGVDSEIADLAAAWGPTLRTRLGSMADMFNGVFKTWAATTKKPEFIANIAGAWESVEGMIGRILTAVAGPGLEAFGQLSRAAKPFIDVLGTGMAKVVDDFARWIDEADNSGDLDQFFEDASNFLRNAGAIGEDIISIFGSVIAILFDASKQVGEADSKSSSFRDTMDDLAAWFNDPENRKKIADFIKQIADFVHWVKSDVIPTIDVWADRIGAWVDRVKGWVDKAREFRDGVKDAFDKVKDAINGFGTGVASFNPFQRFKDGFRDTFNWIIDRWNRLSFDLGPVHLSPWQIPRLAQGAYIPPTPGGSLAIMAEAGKAEWALPDDKLQAALDQAVARGKAGGKAGGDGASAPPSFDVHVYVGDRELKSIVRVEIKESNRDLKRRVQAGTGTR